MVQIYCYTCKAYTWKEWHDLNCPTHVTQKQEKKMIEKFELDELNNDNLIQQSKNTNGALYTRINKLQRDLNIANAEIDRLKNRNPNYHNCVENQCIWKRRYDIELSAHKETLNSLHKVNDILNKIKAHFGLGDD